MKKRARELYAPWLTNNKLCLLVNEVVVQNEIS